jgi:hypothetical protein
MKHRAGYDLLDYRRRNEREMPLKRAYGKY